MNLGKSRWILTTAKYYFITIMINNTKILGWNTKYYEVVTYQENYVNEDSIITYLIANNMDRELIVLYNITSQKYE